MGRWVQCQEGDWRIRHEVFEDRRRRQDSSDSVCGLRCAEWVMVPKSPDYKEFMDKQAFEANGAEFKCQGEMLADIVGGKLKQALEGHVVAYRCKPPRIFRLKDAEKLWLGSVLSPRSCVTRCVSLHEVAIGLKWLQDDCSTYRGCQREVASHEAETLFLGFARSGSIAACQCEASQKGHHRIHQMGDLEPHSVWVDWKTVCGAVYV